MELPILDYMSTDYQEALMFLANGGKMDFIKEFFTLTSEIETRLLIESIKE